LTLIREFNKAGIERFREYLEDSRQLSKSWPQPLPPFNLLEDATLTKTISPRIEIESTSFTTKKDAAEYLVVKLKSLQFEEVRKNAGLWTWLTLFYFDSICPPDGLLSKRVVYNDYRYIFEPNSARNYYRHSLFTSWYVKTLVDRYLETRVSSTSSFTESRLLLSAPIAYQDTATTAVLRRLYLTRIPCIFEVVDRLYWNDTNNEPRRGLISSETKRGNLLHRFSQRVLQLERTYDLMSLDADTLIELLGDEFDFESDSSKK